MAEADMTWVRFTEHHDDREPAAGEQAPTTAYRQGMRCCVTRACAERAKKLRRAIDVPTPNAELAARLAANPWHEDPPAPPPAAQPG